MWYKNNSDTLSVRLVCHFFAQKLGINPKTGAEKPFRALFRAYQEKLSYNLSYFLYKSYFFKKKKSKKEQCIIEQAKIKVRK